MGRNLSMSYGPMLLHASAFLSVEGGFVSILRHVSSSTFASFAGLLELKPFGNRGDTVDGWRKWHLSNPSFLRFNCGMPAI